MTESGRAAALEAIAAEVRTCTRCRLHAGRTKTVPGEGDPLTEVVFIGEGPGRDENIAGRPFVGASGRLLTELIESIGWRREDVFVTNVVKCWPPGNRDPAPDEIAACRPYLERQLEVLDPAVVVSVGKHSLGVVMPGERISRVHGTTRPMDPATGAPHALSFAMYHPAFALYDGSNRTTLFRDIAQLPAALLAARDQRDGSSAERGTAPELPMTGTSAGTSERSLPPVPIVSPAPAVPSAPATPPVVAAPSMPPTLAVPSGQPPLSDADQLTLF